MAAVAALLAANTYLMDSHTRGAAPRDGGKMVDTQIERVNVKIEGEGPPIVMIHGFSEAIDWWDGIAPTRATIHTGQNPLHHGILRPPMYGEAGGLDGATTMPLLLKNQRLCHPRGRQVAYGREPGLAPAECRL